MKDQLNKILNDHYQREFEKVGARYFEKDYVGDILEDQQVVRDIVDLSRELSTIDKRVKQA